ncbi:hypothetical protein [Leptolyngbya ohadii]|uniref:hypothetical protein n=1 Tax=Leptolyngbya ohadii TaxID=1962290 RepID=UPI000B5A129E|nr:hypothetical protein [Leptolyngbya ohadii]
MKQAISLLAGLTIATAALIPALNQTSQAQAPAPASTPTPATRENCVYLREVTTGKAVIRKQIATANTNANVDFAVPSGIAFTSYIAEFLPENNARYRVAVNFKYSDNSSSTPISRDLNAERFYLYNVQLQSPTNRQPFQINTNVRGDRNTAYSVAVLACQ